MKSFIEWLLAYKSRKPFGTPISDLRDDAERAIAMGDMPKKGPYVKLLDAMAAGMACDGAYRAAKEANKRYGAYVRSQSKGSK